MGELALADLPGKEVAQLVGKRPARRRVPGVDADLDQAERRIAFRRDGRIRQADKLAAKARNRQHRALHPGQGAQEFRPAGLVQGSDGVWGSQHHVHVACCIEAVFQARRGQAEAQHPAAAAGGCLHRARKALRQAQVQTQRHEACQKLGAQGVASAVDGNDAGGGKRKPRARAVEAGFAGLAVIEGDSGIAAHEKGALNVASQGRPRSLLLRKGLAAGAGGDACQIPCRRHVQKVFKFERAAKLLLEAGHKAREGGGAQGQIKAQVMGRRDLFLRPARDLGQQGAHGRPSVSRRLRDRLYRVRLCLSLLLVLSLCLCLFLDLLPGLFRRPGRYRILLSRDRR